MSQLIQRLGFTSTHLAVMGSLVKTNCLSVALGLLARAPGVKAPIGAALRLAVWSALLSGVFSSFAAALLHLCFPRVSFDMWAQAGETVRGWRPWPSPARFAPATEDDTDFDIEDLLNSTPDVVRELVHTGDVLSPSSALAITRLRRRARWVRVLEAALGGRRGVVATLLRGRWTPDLPAPEKPDVFNYLLGSVENGVKILGGGATEVEGDGGGYTLDGVYLVVDTGEGVEVVFPQLLGRLRQYSLGRKRDGLLFSALRSRAVEWCRTKRLRSHVADIAVASAVSYAMEVSTHERLTISRANRAIEASHSLPTLL